MKKRFILLLAGTAVLASLYSCTPKAPADPLGAAIESELMKNTVGDYSFKFTTLERVDTTTFRQEIEKRLSSFELILRQNQNLYNSYVRQNKKLNAERKAASVELDKQMIEHLTDLKENMLQQDNVAFYSYKFVAKGKSGDNSFDTGEVYAAVTPDGRVIAMSKELKELKKLTGKVLPGYSDILDRSDDSEEEE